ncbi:MAG: hypothetical protein NT133_26180 [Alphaproteobacteria bacterium]|nr:hypothetical protein [Alphaproteobacteria bacterium]
MIPTIAAAAETLGLALRGGFHPTQDDAVPPMPDGTPTATLLLLGWTGPTHWPAFTTTPEYRDGTPDPLDRWSRRVVGALAEAFGAMPLFPFGGPDFLPFLRLAQRAEPVHPSPIGLLIHPDWGLWHNWRGALAFSTRLALPPFEPCPSPCATCATRPCTAHPDIDDARRACPIGTAYSPAQFAFHRAAFLRTHPIAPH